ncbi:MAG TPA: hypothetical protein DDW66_03395 [Porphyromonadaceae bacterium]|jgi:hypothetical protein|nr:hypothetical protein [Porphyromonadaceae bacterium]
MAVAGFIISCLALLWGVFTYCKHDKKIKSQDEKINQYKLELIEKQKIDEKKAIIEAIIIKGESHKRIIKVYNKGKAIAKNVKIIIPELDNYHVSSYPCPIDIRPQHSIEIEIRAFMRKDSSNSKIDIEFEWSDDFCEFNTDRQTIQLF